MSSEFHYIFGIVPSRRLGKSLGVSAIPHKTCNYSCIYCQLGRTTTYTYKRKLFVEVSIIVEELQTYLEKIAESEYDVITIVGDGEPTLYSGLGELIYQIKKIQKKPVAVISNGALLIDAQVRRELTQADIVLLNFDAWDNESLKRINRPWKGLNFEAKFSAYQQFRQEFHGLLYLEVMLMETINDSPAIIEQLRQKMEKILPDKIFVNTPVRPPAEDFVKQASPEIITFAVEQFAGKPINFLPTPDFMSLQTDLSTAIIEILARHPLEMEDITQFIRHRISIRESSTSNSKDEDERQFNHEVMEILKTLRASAEIHEIHYQDKIFFRKK